MSNQHYLEMSPQARFNEKVLGEPNSGCHLWMGDCFDNGYGKFWYERKSHKAHRISWRLNCGTIPTGLLVLHKCDTPSCVNPDHLFLGTNKDNSQDMISKGRHSRKAPRGEAQNKAKLKEADIPVIRADTRLNRIIAADYGVTEATIAGVKTRRYWKHV